MTLTAQAHTHFLVCFFSNLFCFFWQGNFNWLTKFVCPVLRFACPFDFGCLPLKMKQRIETWLKGEKIYGNSDPPSAAEVVPCEAIAKQRECARETRSRSNVTPNVAASKHHARWATVHDLRFDCCRIRSWLKAAELVAKMRVRNPTRAEWTSGERAAKSWSSSSAETQLHSSLTYLFQARTLSYVQILCNATLWKTSHVSLCSLHEKSCSFSETVKSGLYVFTKDAHSITGTAHHSVATWEKWRKTCNCPPASGACQPQNLITTLMLVTVTILETDTRWILKFVRKKRLWRN